MPPTPKSEALRTPRAGQSIRNAAAITGKGVSTVQRIKAALDAVA